MPDYGLLDQVLTLLVIVAAFDILLAFARRGRFRMPMTLWIFNGFRWIAGATLVAVGTTILPPNRRHQCRHNQRRRP